jgi:uncharacterized protein DUF4013
VRLVAESFAWPFRAKLTVWIWGCVCVLFLPLLFIPVLGYAVAATRSAELYPDRPPPPWRLSFPLLFAGVWTSAVVVVLLAPFALALNPLATALGDKVYSQVIAFFVLLFLWGLLALLLLPHATASFAATGVYTDMFDVAAAVRGVRRDFAKWNLVVTAMVTAWAIGIACAGLLCVGIVPGVFYAILVSAHAAAALHRPIASSPGPSAR